ncbi:MAG: ATP-dependent DNA helicase RecG [Neisseriales bacterium]|nr:MAG: ATP-dependent DNA helicase RecG [Neisseriales bacterium]
MTTIQTENQPIQAPPSTLNKLHKLGLHTYFDLVLHRPLRYENETSICPIKDAPLSYPVLIEGIVEKSDVMFRPRRQLVMRLRDETSALTLRFMHFYPTQVLKVGQRIRAFGEIRYSFLGKEMVHPKLRAVKPLSTTLTPIYPVVKGLTQLSIQRLIRQALDTLSFTDTLPEAIRIPLKLMRLDEAIRMLHAPTKISLFDTQPALQRLKFDELLAQQLFTAQAKQKRQNQQTYAIHGNGKLRAALYAKLPFQLTASQKQVLQTIEKDLGATQPMHRLLQGDVGCGKTIVAAQSALIAIEAGFQVAMMVPTEILAEQHAFQFQEWLHPLGLTTVCLTGRLKKAQKVAVIAQIETGQADFVIGTHTLFQDKLAFHRLGLIIIDEQHRFGVMQRLALKNKGTHVHQLMMSATPIPRTLAMSYFTDMDISSITELPPNRMPIRTQLIDTTRRHQVIEFIRGACQKNEQIYWVCPLIEESEALALKTAAAIYHELTSSLAPIRVGLLHGKMLATQKKTVMEDFVQGHLQVLVATTIIEVGIDVANASLMVIDHAERLGLAQLHQLRGRIGRGTRPSRCLLLFQKPLTKTAKARLEAIYKEQDGFKIAEEDLKIRGHGELLGERQSGLPLFRFANIMKDKILLAEAHREAQTLLSKWPVLAKTHLKRWIEGTIDFLEV